MRIRTDDLSAYDYAWEYVTTRPPEDLYQMCLNAWGEIQQQQVHNPEALECIHTIERLRPSLLNRDDPFSVDVQTAYHEIALNLLKLRKFTVEEDA